MSVPTDIDGSTDVMLDHCDEPGAPRPVLVSYSRFREVQLRRHPFVAVVPSPEEQSAAVNADPPTWVH